MQGDRPETGGGGNTALNRCCMAVVSSCREVLG